MRIMLILIMVFVTSFAYAKTMNIVQETKYTITCPPRTYGCRSLTDYEQKYIFDHSITESQYLDAWFEDNIKDEVIN